MADFTDEFEFILPGEELNKRQAYRIQISGLAVAVEGREGEYPVHDISAAGVAFLPPGNESFTVGEEHDTTLLLKGNTILSSISGKVARVLDNGIVGMVFTNLDVRREAKLDKLILEVQKRLISKRKAESNKK